MPSFQYDLRYIQKGVSVLERYLLSNEMYWTVDVEAPKGEPAYPKLTLEVLLLSILRIQSRWLAPSDENQVTQIISEIEILKNHWQVAWENKANRGYHSRLNLWKNFIIDYKDAPDTHVDRYTYEVRSRVFLEILKKDTGKLDQATQETLEGLDRWLKIILIPSKFIWDMDIEVGFPRDVFWYLYGILPIVMRE
jgi:hypothetical protein